MSRKKVTFIQMQAKKKHNNQLKIKEVKRRGGRQIENANDPGKTVNLYVQNGQLKPTKIRTDFREQIHIV